MNDRERKRAYVIPNPEPRARVIPSDPDGFARFCRQLLQLGPTDPLTSFHLKRLSEELNLHPVAFYNPGNHWTLVTRYDYPLREMHLYDPTDGIKTIKYYSAEKVWYFPSKGHIAFAAGDLSVDKYRLPEEPLEKLGRIMQITSPDCGPLAVYAARVARLS